MGRRIFIFPDMGAEEKWLELSNNIPAMRNSVISMWSSRNSDGTVKSEGLDIGASTSSGRL